LSPTFAYRPEIGTPIADKPGMRALNSGEVATRLSFLATLGPPDAEMLGAATSGALNDGNERARHLGRLLQTDAGQRPQAVFVLEWLASNEPSLRSKAPKVTAGLPPDYEASIRASIENAIRTVLNGPNPSLANLLTGDSYLNDPAVQAVTKGNDTTGDT